MGLEKVLRWWEKDVDSKVFLQRRKFLLKTFGAFLDLEDKTDKALESMVYDACLESIKNNRQVDVRIERVWDIKNAHLNILPGANIRLCGGGKIIDTSPNKVAQINSLKDWSSNIHNLLVIDLPAGAKLTIEDLSINGGWNNIPEIHQRAKGPWNALVRINARGGEVTLKDINFANSINPGITVDHANSVKVSDLSGRDLDALLVVTTSNEVSVVDCNAKDILSDGFLFVKNHRVKVKNSKVVDSPHGILLHGNVESVISNCNVSRALEAYNTSKDDNAWGSVVEFNNCLSVDCFRPFSLSHTYKVSVTGGVHENVGYLHPAEPLVSVYTENIGEINFSGVIMRISPDVVEGYETPHFYGLIYQNVHFPNS